jgi:hypothetical protein
VVEERKANELPLDPDFVLRLNTVTLVFWRAMPWLDEFQLRVSLFKSF